MECEVKQQRSRPSDPQSLVFVHRLATRSSSSPPPSKDMLAKFKALEDFTEAKVAKKRPQKPRRVTCMLPATLIAATEPGLSSAMKPLLLTTVDTMASMPGQSRPQLHLFLPDVHGSATAPGGADAADLPRPLSLLKPSKKLLPLGTRKPQALYPEAQDGDPVRGQPPTSIQRAVLFLNQRLKLPRDESSGDNLSLLAGSAFIVPQGPQQPAPPPPPPSGPNTLALSAVRDKVVPGLTLPAPAAPASDLAAPSPSALPGWLVPVEVLARLRSPPAAILPPADDVPSSALAMSRAAASPATTRTQAGSAPQLLQLQLPGGGGGLVAGGAKGRPLVEGLLEGPWQIVVSIIPGPATAAWEFYWSQQQPGSGDEPLSELAAEQDALLLRRDSPAGPVTDLLAEPRGNAWAAQMLAVPGAMATDALAPPLLLSAKKQQAEASSALSADSLVAFREQTNVVSKRAGGMSAFPDAAGGTELADAVGKRASGKSAALNPLSATQTARDSLDGSARDSLAGAARDPLDGAVRHPLAEASKGPLAEAAKGPLAGAARNPLAEAARSPLAVSERLDARGPLAGSERLDVVDAPLKQAGGPAERADKASATGSLVALRRLELLLRQRAAAHLAGLAAAPSASLGARAATPPPSRGHTPVATPAASATSHQFTPAACPLVSPRASAAPVAVHLDSLLPAPARSAAAPLATPAAGAALRGSDATPLAPAAPLATLTASLASLGVSAGSPLTNAGENASRSGDLGVGAAASAPAAGVSAAVPPAAVGEGADDPLAGLGGSPGGQIFRAVERWSWWLEDFMAGVKPPQEVEVRSNKKADAGALVASPGDGVGPPLDAPGTWAGLASGTIIIAPSIAGAAPSDRVGESAAAAPSVPEASLSASVGESVAAPSASVGEIFTAPLPGLGDIASLADRAATAPSGDGAASPSPGTSSSSLLPEASLGGSVGDNFLRAVAPWSGWLQDFLADAVPAQGVKGSGKASDAASPGVSAAAPLASLGGSAAAPLASLGGSASASLSSLGESAAAPLANLGESASAPPASLGESASAPLASLGESASAPPANLGESVAAPLANLGADFSVPSATSSVAPPLTSPGAIPASVTSQAALQPSEGRLTASVGAAAAAGALAAPAVLAAAVATKMAASEVVVAAAAAAARARMAAPEVVAEAGASKMVAPGVMAEAGAAEAAAPEVTAAAATKAAMAPAALAAGGEREAVADATPALATSGMPSPAALGLPLNALGASAPWDGQKPPHDEGRSSGGSGGFGAGGAFGSWWWQEQLMALCCMLLAMVAVYMGRVRAARLAESRGGGGAVVGEGSGEVEAVAPAPPASGANAVTDGAGAGAAGKPAAPSLTASQAAVNAAAASGAKAVTPEVGTATTALIASLAAAQATAVAPGGAVASGASKVTVPLPVAPVARAADAAGLLHFDGGWQPGAAAAPRPPVASVWDARSALVRLKGEEASLQLELEALNALLPHANGAEGRAKVLKEELNSVRIQMNALKQQIR